MNQADKFTAEEVCFCRLHQIFNSLKISTYSFVLPTSRWIRPLPLPPLIRLAILTTSHCATSSHTEMRRKNPNQQSWQKPSDISEAIRTTVLLSWCDVCVEVWNISNIPNPIKLFNCLKFISCKPLLMFLLTVWKSKKKKVKKFALVFELYWKALCWEPLRYHRTSLKNPLIATAPPSGDQWNSKTLLSPKFFVLFLGCGSDSARKPAVYLRIHFFCHKKRNQNVHIFG